MISTIDPYLDQLNPSQSAILDAFFEQYCQKDEAYLLFAAHAAFPVVLTADLLYKIWINFKKDEIGQTLHLPQTIVSDLLLSPLCQTIARHVYEIPQGIRAVLQRYLVEHHQFGSKRLDRLAHFLKHYLQENPQKVPSLSFFQAQEFAYLARLEPQKAAERVLEAWNKAEYRSDLQHLVDQAEMLDGVEKNQEGSHNARNQLGVAIKLLRGLQEYQYGEPEKMLARFKELQGLIREGESKGGIKVNVDQRLVEALPENIFRQDDRPIFLGAFLSSLSGHTHLPEVVQERNQLEETIQSISGMRCVSLVNNTFQGLVDALTNFEANISIFHFAGHGKNDKLILEGSEIAPLGLAKLLSKLPKLKLIFLNSLNSAEFKAELFSYGIPAIIAIDGTVTDNEANFFASKFYSSLAINLSIVESFETSLKGWKKWKSENDTGVSDISDDFKSPWRLYLNKPENDWRLSDDVNGLFPSQSLNEELLDDEPIEISKVQEVEFSHHLNKIPLLKNPEECIGRSSELIELHLLVQNHKEITFIAGAAGIGKTTLFRAYLSQHQHEFKHLVWINLKENLEQSAIQDPDLMILIDQKSLEKKNDSSHFRKLIELLNKIPGPNLLIIDSSESNLLPYEIEGLLPRNDYWKTIVSCRSLEEPNAITLKPLNSQYAWALFSNHYEGGSEKEVNILLSLIGHHPLSILLVANFLNSFRGALSVSSLIQAANQKKLNIKRIERFLAQTKEDEAIAIKIKNWLEIEGEKEIIRDAILRYLEKSAEEREANIVISAWLNTDGVPIFIASGVKRYLTKHAKRKEAAIVLSSWLKVEGELDVIKLALKEHLSLHAELIEAAPVIQRWIEKAGEKDEIIGYLKKYLNRHANKKEANEVMTTWLKTGGQPDSIKTAVKRHLDSNAKEKNYLGLIVAWLGAGGDPELVKDATIKYLRRNSEADQIALLVNIWLQAGGNIDVVEESVTLLMRLGPMEIVTGSIIQNWLRANGDKKIIEAPIQRYLEKYDTNYENGFLLIAWLEASGEKKVIEKYVIPYLKLYQNTENGILVKEHWGKHNRQEGAIKALITASRLKEALNALEKLVPDYLHNDVILQQSRLNGLERQENYGTISRENAIFERSKIRGAIMSIYTDAGIKEIEPEPIEATEEHSNNLTERDTGDGFGDQSELMEIPAIEPLAESLLVPKGEDGKTKILFLTANPSYQQNLAVDRESKLVMVEAEGRALDVVICPHIDRGSMISMVAFQKPQIVHFSGHGKDGSLAMIDPSSNKTARVENDDLVEIFSLFKEIGVKCVVLCSCWSFSQAKVISELEIPVIGMLRKIGDEEAIQFSRDLYYLLMSNNPLERIFKLAKLKITKASREIPSLWYNGKRIA